VTFPGRRYPTASERPEANVYRRAAASIVNVLRSRWRRGRRSRSRAVSNIVAATLMTAITVVTLVLVYLIRFPLPVPPPTISYSSVNWLKFPAWGDPTDCYPILPYSPSYYLGNGTGNSTDQNRYNTYMDAWWDDCEYGDSGTYNLMNATEVLITGVSTPIPLSGIEFEFICVNTTPTPETTYLVQGQLGSMEWVPGGSQNLSSTAPYLGTCATYDPRGSGANSVYYNRLGFFNPLDTRIAALEPGMSLVIYVNTPDAIIEAPNPLEDQSVWNIGDLDDYHGAPLWCFTVPGSCSIELIDTDWSYPVVLLDIPVYVL